MHHVYFVEFDVYQCVVPVSVDTTMQHRSPSSWIIDYVFT